MDLGGGTARPRPDPLGVAWGAGRRFVQPIESKARRGNGKPREKLWTVTKLPPRMSIFAEEISISWEKMYILGKKMYIFPPDISIFAEEISIS